MRIVIGNLPDNVTEEGIRAALSSFAPVGAISLVPDAGTPVALIEMEMTRVQAEALATKIKGRVHEGKALTAWVPNMDWRAR